MQNIILSFIAGAIVQEQERIFAKYRDGRKGTIVIRMSVKDDTYADFLDRAITDLGFCYEDFPELPEMTYTGAPLSFEHLN